MTTANTTAISLPDAFKTAKELVQRVNLLRIIKSKPEYDAAE